MAIKGAINDFCAVFSERLRNARKMRQLSQKALAERLKVTASAIEKYEKGLMIPSSDVMLEMEQVLGLDQAYFFTENKLNVDFSKFEFRKRSTLGKKKQEAIMIDIVYRLEKYLEIERITGCEVEFKLSKYVVTDEASARKAANELRKKLKLGYDPIAAPIALLESLGVKIIEVDEDDKFDGVSTMIDGKIALIVLNKNKSAERKRLTLFHELAHLILIMSEDVDEEKMCNVFANEMLITENDFRFIFSNSRKGISLVELIDVQKAYGISPEALMMKAHQLGIISDNRYKMFCIRKNQNKTLLDDLRTSRYQDESTDRFRRLVFMSLAKEQITFSKAASLLGEGVDQVREELKIVS